MKQEDIEELCSDLDDAVDLKAYGDTCVVSFELLFRCHRLVRFVLDNIQMFSALSFLSQRSDPVCKSDGESQLYASVVDAEVAVLMAAIRDSGGNMVKAAKIAGVNRRTLYRKINKYGLRKGTPHGGE